MFSIIPFIDIIPFPAVLITGGWGTEQSVEIYHPDRKSACKIGLLPDRRVYHTQDGSLVCGGWLTTRSCRRLNADTGDWDLDLVTESITEERYLHISWTPVDRSVTYLMGGRESPLTSEAIDQDNVVRASFPLRHSTE